jgi:DNA-binding MarR family transcriptional regulator
MSALAFCLGLQRAGASLRRKLDDELGLLHGIGWDDFVLLSFLDGRPEGVPLTSLADGLGLAASAALRRLPPLEKTGLLARQRVAGGLQVALCAGGSRVLREARTSAAALCDEALHGTDLADAAGVLARLGASSALLRP